MPISVDTRSSECISYSLDEFRSRSDLSGNPVFKINDYLNLQAIPYTLNETQIEDYLSLLWQGKIDHGLEFWLLMARLAEAALLCAGHYADNGEFSAAGDLLVNPRRVVIYQKRHQPPIVKPRHAKVSEALGWSHLSLEIRNRKLRSLTLVRIEQTALLPDILTMIADSGQFDSSYLESIQQRMKRVVDTIGFLSAWGVTGSQDLYRQLREASPQVRRFVLSQCCRFEDAKFKELGTAIDGLRRPAVQLTA